MEVLELDADIQGKIGLNQEMVSWSKKKRENRTIRTLLNERLLAMYTRKSLVSTRLSTYQEKDKGKLVNKGNGVFKKKKIGKSRLSYLQAP